MKNNIADYIPYGHDNGVSLDELYYITGIDERRIRKEISESKDLIINMQDGKGYFRPTRDEIELVIGWKNIIKSRQKELDRRIKDANLWMKGCHDIE